MLLNVFQDGSLDSPVVHESLDNFTHYLTHQFPSLGARKYPSLCYRPTEAVLADGTAAVPCFTAQSHNPRSLTQTLTFVPGAREEFVAALNRQSKFYPDDSPVRFAVDNRQTEAIGQMKNGKWIAYAVWALALRFWDLAKAYTLDFISSTHSHSCLPFCRKQIRLTSSLSFWAIFSWSPHSSSSFLALANWDPISGSPSPLCHHLSSPSSSPYLSRCC